METSHQEYLVDKMAKEVSRRYHELKGRYPGRKVNWIAIRREVVIGNGFRGEDVSVMCWQLSKKAAEFRRPRQGRRGRT